MGEPAADLMPSPRLRHLLAKIDDLAVLPHVVYKVLELSGSTENSAIDMERAITVDPGFTSKVLILANSAATGLPRKVVSTRDAINVLGFRAVRQLAMAAGIFDLFVGKTDKESLRRRQWWRHSVDTAVCCKFIAGQMKTPTPEDAYTCGLLHYIGKTLLDRSKLGSYDDVESLMAFGMNTELAESEIFGANHVEVACAAAVKWGLPPELVAGLNYLDEPADDDPHRVHRAVTALGSAIAELVMLGRVAEEPGSAHWAPDWPTRILDITSEQLQGLVHGGTAAILQATTHFA